MPRNHRRREQNPHGSNIELHIDELVLHGFAPGERYRIGDAIQLELARLLTQQGLAFTRGAEIEQLTVNARVNSQTSGTNNGTHIARAVYDGLNNRK